MFTTILFSILAYQRMNIESILQKQGNPNIKEAKRKADIGLWGLGIISLLSIIFNIWLHRGWWNSDFFSPFFTGFKH